MIWLAIITLKKACTMSHSLKYQFIHLLWATKNLQRLITEDSKAALLGYLTGVLKGLGGALLATSGVANHVHLLANTPTDVALSDLLRQIKSCSSKWFREKDNKLSTFGWNEGYAAFTVCPSSIIKVKKYLSTEENRHIGITYEDELTNFLKIQEIKFNPQFLTNTTYTKLIYHLVWSVKNREPILNKNLQPTLHQCIQECVQKNGGKLHAVGNVADHIHLLVECPGKISTASLMQALKTSTTYLIRSHNRKDAHFSWQEGYGVFSVGKPAFEVVSNYVKNQESHHNTNSFEEEWNCLRSMNYRLQ
jgi:putative transposase